MKKLLAPITAFATAVILLSSCSNSSKLAFTKRHYRSGYFHDIITRNQNGVNPSIALQPVKPKQHITPPVTAKSENRIEQNPPLVESATQPVITQKAISQKKALVNSFAITYSNSALPYTNVANTKAANDVEGSAGGDHGGRENVSVPFVVIVLCAIFIPPLGVGLMYGINSYFWIDLILTLIFFFPGMIFALIVVLM